MRTPFCQNFSSSKLKDMASSLEKTETHSRRHYRRTIFNLGISLSVVLASRFK